MNGWLLDTNIVSELGRRRPDDRVEAWLGTLDRDVRWVSVLTVAELDKGIEALKPGDVNRQRHAQFRARMEAEFRGRVLPLSNDVVRLWGAICGRRVFAGLGPAAPIDALLAATAVHHGLYLATRNTKHVTGLGAVFFNPWDDDPALFPLSR